MDENKAIKIIKQEMGWERKSSTLRAFDTAIKALEEVQQYGKHGVTVESALNNMCDLVAAENLIEEYSAIGTPEECRAAVERNNEKTRIIDGITECCGYDFGTDAFQMELSKFCPACGRKIERSGEE